MSLTSMLAAILAVVGALGGLSLLASGMVESWASWHRWRSSGLDRGLRALLGESRDAEGRPLRDRLRAAPLVQALGEPGRASAPSYMPASLFSQTLIELILPDAWQGGSPAFGDLVRHIDRLPPSDLREALRALARASDRDPERFRRSLEVWFDQVMDRAAGWYRRRVTLAALVAATVLCVGLDVDTLALIAGARGAEPASPIEAALAPPTASRVEPALPTTPPASTPAPPVEPGATDRPAALPEAPPAPAATDPRPRGVASPVATRGLRPRGPRASEGRSESWGAWLGRVEAWLGGLGPSPVHLLGTLLSIAAVTLAAPLTFDLLARVANPRFAGRRPGLASPPAAEPVERPPSRPERAIPAPAPAPPRIAPASADREAAPHPVPRRERKSATREL